MIRSSVTAFFLLILTLPLRSAAAVDFEGTPAEKELVALLDSVNDQYSAYWQKRRELKDDPVALDEFRKANNPAQECVPKLLAFEEQQRGTLTGLMALRRIINMAVRGGGVESPGAIGRRKVLDRLANYVDMPEIMILLGHLGRGAFEPRIEDTLRAFATGEKASPLVRGYSKLALGRWMLKTRDSHEKSVLRLQSLREGVTPDYPTEKQSTVEYLDTLPAAALTDTWQKEAVELLREVAESSTELYIPKIDAADPQRYLLRAVEDPGETVRCLADSAKASLFKESHLRLGRKAPDLEVELLSGEKWSMAEQQEKAVILQFSLKTCGPCRRMYPDLRELQQQYGEQLSILSLMSDKERTDTEQSVADGDVTWNIHWEGRRGPIGNLWSVNSWPTVYVVDPQGKIAGVDLRGEQLKKKIGELLN